MSFSDTLFIFKAIEYFCLEERRERKGGKEGKKEKKIGKLFVLAQLLGSKHFLTLLS